MIKYALACTEGHAFESWFPNGEAYDTQVRRGFVRCPQCGSKEVSKAIMAPAVVTRATPHRSVEPTPVPAVSPPAAAPMALLDERAKELRAMLRAVRDRVLTEAENVGGRFAAEARRIHDGDAAERPIYGEASLPEVKSLLEDGIGVMPLPILPDEHN